MPPPPPFAMLAELTHACPLHCVYCSNPLELTRRAAELETAGWLRVLREARDLGVVQVHLSGGEPLLRDDLETLTGECAALELFTHLVTSGVGLTPERARVLGDSGLNSIQLSVQSSDAAASDRIAGYKSWALKEAAAGAARSANLPITVNVVLHRHNLDQVDEIIDLAVAWGATRLELANTQYYSWALTNRAHLLPGRDQVARATTKFRRRKAELDGRLEMVWVIPDYHATRPKPCMGGWAQRSLTIAPDGRALPCPVAGSITSLTFDSVRDRSLSWIWNESPAFNAFRGEEWMREPCRSCEFRGVDFGGCRCQAFALTGDATRTDPVCTLSPDRSLIESALELADGSETGPLRGAVYRGAHGRPQA